MNIHETKLPVALLKKFEGRHSKYTDLLTIYHVVCLDQDCWCGVVGDGDNGAYEWFYFVGDKVEISDAGFGDSTCALRSVLNLKAA